MLTRVSTTATAQVLPFEYYSLSEGLPSGWILALYQDSRGFLWIGTDEGFSIYDGAEFHNYGTQDGLPISRVVCFCESRTSPGTMWIGTPGGGICKFANGKLTSRKLGSTIESNVIEGIAETPDGSLIIATQRILYELIDTTLRELRLPSKNILISMFYQTSRREIWVGRYNEALVLSGNGELKATIAFPLQRTAILTGCVEGRDGSIWVVSNDGWLFHLRHQKIISSRRVAGRTLSPLVSLSEDAFHRLWISTNSGLLVTEARDDSSNSIIEYAKANGLKEKVSVSFCDRENNLWFGGYNDGLVKLAQQNIVKLKSESSFPQGGNHAAVTDASGHIWLIRSNGLWEIWQQSRGNWHTYVHSFHSNLETEQPFTIWLEQPNRLWIAFGPGSLKCFEFKNRAGDHATLRLMKEMWTGNHFPAGRASTVMIDRKGNLWLGIQEVGVFAYDPRLNRIVHSIPVAQLAGPRPSIMMHDRDDAYWIGDYLNGLVKGKFVGGKFDVLSRVSTDDGLPDNCIRSLFEDSRGNHYVGTRYGGFAVMQGDSITRISRAQGLMSNGVWGFAEDSTGNLWIATSLGIQWTSIEMPYKFETRSGLDGRLVGSIGLAPDGIIWGATWEWLTLFDTRVPTTQLPPPTHITSFLVNGNRRDPGSQTSLSDDDNNIDFEFVGLSFVDERSMRYEYRLVGVDDKWIGPVKERRVSYAALGAGSYTFEVRAITGRGIPSEHPASVAFTIARPFWQQAWFIAAAIVLGAILFMGIGRLRVRRLLEIEKIRSRIATDLHDDIGSGLTHIGLLSEVTLRQYQNNPAAYDYSEPIRHVGEIARGLSQEMSDVVWSINPKHDSLSSLIDRLRSFAFELCKAREIALNFEVADQIRHLKLNPEIRRGVLLIAKEALHNMAKHSSASTVTVTLSTIKNAMVVVVGDDGVGFVETENIAGNGLSNMKVRAEKLHGTCTIESHPGSGTTVRAIIPTKE